MAHSKPLVEQLRPRCKIVFHSFNLCNWQEILRIKSQQSGPMGVPVRFDNSQGFWRIESFAEP